MTSSTTLSPSRLKRRWQHAQGNARKRLIIETALDLLRRRGPQDVTMRRVAARLGVGAMTLYTYIDGQAELHRQMTRRGFEILQGSCEAASTLETLLKWRGGSMAYLNFAIDNPNLYKLMFDVPLTGAPEDEVILRGGFAGLLDKVTLQMSGRGLCGRELERQACASARRFWFALHGLASLLIAGRASILMGDVEELLDDLLEHVAPT